MLFKYFNVNASGYSIRCKIYYKDIKTIKKLVICAHGFGGHKDNKAVERFSEYVMKKYSDIAVVAFNAPAHGDDVRKTITLNECDIYINAVTDYVKNRYKTDELYGYATSFGGYLFLKYITENKNPFRKIALRCPAVNMYEVLCGSIMTESNAKALLNGKPVAVGFDRKIKINREFLEDLKKNDIRKRDFKPYSDSILILHGTKDEVVPFKSGEKFAAENAIEFVPIENADHRFKDPVIMDSAIKKIVKFFEF